jgi:hypothetical protein
MFRQGSDVSSYFVSGMRNKLIQTTFEIVARLRDVSDGYPYLRQVQIFSWNGCYVSEQCVLSFRHLCKKKTQIKSQSHNSVLVLFTGCY